MWVITSNLDKTKNSFEKFNLKKIFIIIFSQLLLLGCQTDLPRPFNKASYHKKENSTRNIPVCCSFYMLILNIKGDSVQHINQYSYKVKTHSLQLLVPGLIYSFEDNDLTNESLMILFRN